MRAKKEKVIRISSTVKILQFGILRSGMLGNSTRLSENNDIPCLITLKDFYNKPMEVQNEELRNKP